MKSIIAQLTSIEGLTTIEGKASNVSQARACIIPNGGFDMVWGSSWQTSYECAFRISGAPVALRVSSPIFIKDGETIRVVGQRNSDGVFDAVAYWSQSSQASGRAKRTWSQWKQAIFGVVAGGLLEVFIAIFALSSESLNKRPSPDDVLFISIAMGFAGVVGLALTLYGLVMVVRYRREGHEVERLLNMRKVERKTSWPRFSSPLGRLH